MTTASNGESGRRARARLLRILDQEYCHVVKFVMRLGASLPEAAIVAQDVYAQTWESVTRRPLPWPGAAQLRKSIRIAAYEAYLRPVPARQPVPASVAQRLQRTSAANASPPDLTVGTRFVLDALHNLDPVHRAVLALQMDQFSVSEITVVLGIADDLTTCGLLEKARKTLARELAGCRV